MQCVSLRVYIYLAITTLAMCIMAIKTPVRARAQFSMVLWLFAYNRISIAGVRRGNGLRPQQWGCIAIRPLPCEKPGYVDVDVDPVDEVVKLGGVKKCDYASASERVSIGRINRDNGRGLDVIKS